jgi:hypothetical protein
MRVISGTKKIPGADRREGLREVAAPGRGKRQKRERLFAVSDWLGSR